MKIEQALAMIDKALATIQTNRESHLALQQAMQVITKELGKKDEKIPKSK